MEDRNLDIETHLKYFTFLGYGEEEAHREAQYRHAGFVSSALADLFLRLNMLTNVLKSKDATYFLRYGAARRLQMMLWSYATITSTAPPDRMDPLSDYERRTLSRDINVIYMHMRGVLDNFAWCFLFENEPSLIEELHKNDISLFSKKIRKKTEFQPFWEEIDRHQDWNKKLKGRRDPVAHRIPLYVPPSILTPDEAVQYEQALQTHTELTITRDFDGADAAFRQTDQIGRFFPCFMHDPNFGPVPIYPTVPADMAHLIRLGKTVRDHLE
jgi:hypothetical protein